MSVASALPLLSPLVTRILQLSGFPPQLKTRDLQQIFAAYEDENGGYKIKWVDDTTALIIFADPATAKKAYLRTIMAPSPQLINDNGVPAKIKPYDRDDASSIISSVSNRQRSRSNGGAAILGSPTKQPAELLPPSTPDSPAKPLRGHAHTPSFSRTFGHRRQQSGSNPNLPPKPVAAALFDAANGGPSPANRVLAGVDTLSGIAGLPANPVAAARSSFMAESPSKMSRNSSQASSSDATLETDLASLSLSSISNGKNGNVSKNSTVSGLGSLLSAPVNISSNGAGKRLSSTGNSSSRSSSAHSSLRASPLPRANASVSPSASPSAEAARVSAATTTVG